MLEPSISPNHFAFEKSTSMSWLENSLRLVCSSQVALTNFQDFEEFSDIRLENIYDLTQTEHASKWIEINLSEAFGLLLQFRLTVRVRRPVSVQLGRMRRQATETEVHLFVERIGTRHDHAESPLLVKSTTTTKSTSRKLVNKNKVWDRWQTAVWRWKWAAWPSNGFSAPPNGTTVS